MSGWSSLQWRTNPAGPQTRARTRLRPATRWALLSWCIPKLTLLNTTYGGDGVWTQGNNHCHAACSTTDFPTHQNQTRHQKGNQRTTPARTENCYGVTAWSPDCVSPMGDCVTAKQSQPGESPAVRRQAVWDVGDLPAMDLYQCLPFPCQQGHHTTSPSPTSS